MMGSRKFETFYDEQGNFKLKCPTCGKIVDASMQDMRDHKCGEQQDRPQQQARPTDPSNLG